MAKKSRILKNNKRKKTALQYASTRASLKAVLANSTATEEERYKAQTKLEKLPRDSNPIRVRNRCALTGRSRGVYSKFGLGRIKLREKALKGELPGVTKSSW